MAGTNGLIHIEGLTKVFSGLDGEVTALDGIDLTIDEGEIYGIVGLSGAGKSTLIRCLNRLDSPTGGRVIYRGNDLSQMDDKQLRALRRDVAMIFQSFNLFMQRTVSDNIRYPLDITGVKRREAEERVAELLATVGLSDKARAYPSQLSGGQKQRVAIARALALKPRVILCDEATSALDPITTQSILALLQDINQRLGITVIIITHEMAVVRQICTRVAILDKGKVAEEGNVDEVFVNTKSEAGQRLFGILPDTPDEKLPLPALRIVFDGSAAEKPIIARLIKEQGFMINILSANIKHLGGKNYGQMLIEAPPTEQDKHALIDYLATEGLSAKEVIVP